MQEAREDSYAIYWKGWREEFHYPWCFPVKSWWVPVEKKTAKFREYQHASHVWNNQNSRTCSVFESLNIFCCSIFQLSFFWVAQCWPTCTKQILRNGVRVCNTEPFPMCPLSCAFSTTLGCGRVGLWRVLISLISAGVQTAPNGSKPFQATRQSFFGRKTLKISTTKRWLNISQKAIGQSGMV